MSGEINVISRTQHIIVEPAFSAVSIINAGPPGPNTGIPGPPGVVQSITAGEGIAVDSSTPAAPIVSFKVVPWVNLTLLNSWAAENPLYAAPQCRKIGDLVYTRGSCVRLGAAGTSVVFAYPTGLRPPKALRVGIIAHQHNSGGVFTARCDLNTDGNFQVTQFSAAFSDPAIYLNDIPPFSVTE